MIHVENLTKYYHQFCAVDQISFDVPKGEILGLLGPNGAGKTTTMRMMTGFLAPSSGEILIKNLSITENPLEVKKIMGYLPESAPLYHDMLVFDYLHYVADIRELQPSVKPGRIRDLADLCALNDVMHKTIGELSKGYKQRVGLAHAMMSDPEILVLDEPTSGLDPNQIIEIREIIKKIGKEKTIFLSTHILTEAEATCDRIIIIHKGRIAADDRTEKLIQTAGNKSVINLCVQGATFEEVNTLITGIPGISRTEKGEEGGQTLKLKAFCDVAEDLRPAIYEKIKATPWLLLEFVRETRSLETIFRDLTKEN
ncbi:MAG: ATP-binding cassette domain-containing protein [Desulfobacteraceae bacterium]|nr:ATP-binding cassette domain-containing protein [Desulfobacteraceae bacterium]MBU4054691.1 ABC transporter ATP-binding protein [Pseudomonadota bacterium]